MTTKDVGDAGEAQALAHLLGQGLALVERNYRVARGPNARGGEVDLILREPDGTLVFVEVRTRRGAPHGDGSSGRSAFGGGSPSSRTAFGGGSSASRTAFGGSSSSSRSAFGGGSSASRTAFGGAAASVGATKQRRLVLAAQHYLSRFKTLPACRFDVVTVEGQGAHARIEWFRAAFDTS